MKQYRLVNNLTGWLTFLVAAFTYCMTVEPSASFWDCPEFITTAFKLEVGHPPGAPFFMLTGNFFTLFTDDVTKVALCVNIMSALLSAFCILFLFWSVTHLVRKLICTDGIVTETWQTVTIMGAGLTGALAYTWSDTFWFSAVEGEVYAYSSMFTALVFWLILKWEDHADEPRSDRWLILIFYLTGLSIGVHLLNLLCLPAITLVYYFKKHPQAQLRGSLSALGVSALLVVAVLYGVVPGIVKVGGEFELFFVNTLGMSFNTGLVVYILVLIAVVLSAIYFTTRKDRVKLSVLYLASVALLGIPFIGNGWQAFGLGMLLLAVLAVVLFLKGKDGEYLLRKRFLNTSLMCMLMLMIGYSSYAVIVVRSTQNTPMDQNSPEDVFTLGSYLSREQYGNRPLLYGETYLSKPSYDIVVEDDVPRYAYNYKKRTRVQQHVTEDPNAPDAYDTYEEIEEIEYPSAVKMLFPRVYSRTHQDRYNEWLGINPDNPEDLEGWFPAFKKVEYTLNFPDAPYGYPDHEDVTATVPTQWTNLRFFLSYQVNFMYWRYFLWNFAGRQNDVQGNGELEMGNWLTGFPAIDNALYGDQDLLPDNLKNNKGHNVFYCLPLLLGLIGLFWQAFRGQKGVQQFWVVFFLFFMTGLAIVLYLNQTPGQPRERDYAYAGSFYAFAIWIGMAVAALVEGAMWLRRRFRWERLAITPVAAIISCICLLVPVQMVSQTWDDHDRSDRYACRDFGMNYLATLPENQGAVIFTNGDNDTFPLWYAHEVEGYRTDTRVCNLSYLETDWYIDQMRRPAYASEGLPIAWERSEYVNNMGHDSYEIRPEDLEAQAVNAPGGDPLDLKWLIDTYVRPKGYLPTYKVHVRVNKEAVRKSGMLLPDGADGIPDYMELDLSKDPDVKSYGTLTKKTMMILEMLARNDWKRPLYMSYTLGMNPDNNIAGLYEFLTLEGLAYRVTPFPSAQPIVDTDRMYDNLMNRFKYGNVAHPGIYLDETVSVMCYRQRHLFYVLAGALIAKGDRERALKVMEKCMEVLPATTIPYDYAYDLEAVKIWLQLGQTGKARTLAFAIARQSRQYLEWAGSIGSGKMNLKGGRFVDACGRQITVLKSLILEFAPADTATQKALEKTLRECYRLPVMKHCFGYALHAAQRNLENSRKYADEILSAETENEQRNSLGKYYRCYQNLFDNYDMVANSGSQEEEKIYRMLLDFCSSELGIQAGLLQELYETDPEKLARYAPELAELLDEPELQAYGDTDDTDDTGNGE